MKEGISYAKQVIETYLAERKGLVSERRKEYLLSLKELLETAEENNLAAVHGPCPDGTISGVLIKFLYPEITVIPMDYWLIKDETLGRLTEKLPWKAIGDLIPLNQEHVKKLYFDHHRTAIGRLFNAEKVYFDANGESASSVLFDALKNKIEFPPHFEKLVEITRITDTGNHPGNPPTVPPKKTEDSTWEELIWLFEDASSSCRTALDITDLMNGYLKEGINYLNRDHIQARIKELRNERKTAWEIGQKVEKADFIVFVVKDEQLDHRSLLRSVLTRANIGGASVVEELDGSSRISLRIRKDYQKSTPDWEKYRVDLLAREMNGGGHMAAAGAKTQTVEEAINKITNWCSEKGLNIKVLDLRQQ